MYNTLYYMYNTLYMLYPSAASVLSYIMIKLFKVMRVDFNNSYIPLYMFSE